MRINNKRTIQFNRFRTVKFMFIILLLIGVLSACLGAADEAAIEKAIALTMTAQEVSSTQIAEHVNATVAAQEKENLEEGSMSPEEIETLVAEQINAQGTAVPASAPDNPELVATLVDEQVNATLVASDLTRQAEFDAEEAANAAEPVVDSPVTGDNDLTTATQAEVYITANSNVNVRSGPGVMYDWAGQLEPGDRVFVIAESENGWYNIGTGWIFAAYTDFVEGSTTDVSMAATTPRPPTPTRSYPTMTPSITPTPAATATAVPTATPTPSITPSVTATAVATNVIIVNNSTATICKLLIHPATAPSDDNRLEGKDPLAPNAQITIPLTENATVFDFEARSCSTDTVVDSDDAVQIFNNYVWSID